MFKILNQTDKLNVLSNQENSKQIAVVQLTGSCEDWKQLIHDSKGAMRTFRYLSQKSIKPDDPQASRKTEVLNNYLEKIDILIQLAEEIGKPSP